MQFTPLQLVYLARKADKASMMLSNQEFSAQKELLLTLCDNSSTETTNAVAVQSVKEWFTQLHNCTLVKATGLAIGYTEEEAVGNAVKQFKEDFFIVD